jgi:predicted LPLAT superfamily acyltransferase
MSLTPSIDVLDARAE